MGHISCPDLDHIGKALHCLCKAGNGLIRIPVFDPVPHTVFDVAFQHHLAHLVKSGLGRIDLCKDILAGNILIHHPVNGLDLSDDLLQAAV